MASIAISGTLNWNRYFLESQLHSFLLIFRTRMASCSRTAWYYASPWVSSLLQMKYIKIPQCYFIRHFLPLQFGEKTRQLKKKERKTVFGLKKCDRRCLDREIVSKFQKTPRASTTTVLWPCVKRTAWESKNTRRRNGKDQQGKAC